MSRQHRSPDPVSLKGNRSRVKAIAWLTVLMAVLAGCSAGGVQTPASVETQATSATASFPATTLASVSDLNSTDCIIRDESGQQIWFGGASSRVTALGNALQAIVDKHNDQATGVALCSHYEGATIFVVSPTDDVDKSIAAVASKFPDLRVITRTVAASITQLFAVGRKLLKGPDLKGFIAGVSPDIHSGGLVITVAQDKWPLAENEKHRIDNAVVTINGSRLPLTYEQGGTPVLD